LNIIDHGRNWFERRIADPRTFIISMLGPTLAVMIVIGIGPMVYVLIVSLTDYNIFRPDETTIVWLGNFINALGDPRFWRSIWRTIQYSVGAVSIELILGMVIALLLNREIRGRGIFRTVLLLPIAATPVAVTLAWKLIMNPVYGVISYILYSLGLPVIAWFAAPETAMVSLILVDIWQWTPFVALILLAGLTALPNEPIEAAIVDGANRWQVLRFVTLPLLKPILILATLFRSIDCLRTFDYIYVLTRGGPGDVTETLNFYTYLTFFKGNIGYASALAFVMIQLTFLLATLMLRGTQLGVTPTE
jgi:multiple sugar transport system permease protein